MNGNGDRLPNGRDSASFSQKSKVLRELLSDAVRMRLVSDVPLGILLSGGIDSSTVAAFATQHATEKVKTFSIGFEEDSFDESKYARLVAKHLDTEHYEDRLSAEKAGDLISEIGQWLDEPLSDGSLIPTYLLARFVRQHVTVALGGDGGDELFAGYPMYYAHKVAAYYRTIPKFVRSGLIEPVVNALPVSTKNMSFDYKAKRFVRASVRFVLDRPARTVADAGRARVHRRRYLPRCTRNIERRRDVERHRADAASGREVLHGRGHPHQGRPRRDGREPGNAGAFS
jgi:asparagine synthase (glutamine-hydrolysing)